MACWSSHVTHCCALNVCSDANRAEKAGELTLIGVSFQCVIGLRAGNLGKTAVFTAKAGYMQVLTEIQRI